MTLAVQHRTDHGDAAFANADWSATVSAYAGCELSPVQLVRRAIASVRNGDCAAAALLTPALICSASARKLIRGQLVNPLMRAGDNVTAVTVATALVAADPENRDDRLLLATLLSRVERPAEALALLDKLADGDPGDAIVAAARLRACLAAGDGSRAAAVAAGHGSWHVLDSRLGHLAMLALTRSGDDAETLRLAERLVAEMTLSVDTAVLAVAAAARSGAIHEVARLAKIALARGFDHPALHADLGRALMAQREIDSGIAAFANSLHARPDDIRTLAGLGEALLVRGRAKEAAVHLGHGVTMAPQLSHMRTLHARALKQTRNYAAAAEEMLVVAKARPADLGVVRQAAAALNMAGRTQEAEALFTESIALRASTLPAAFTTGLEALWARADAVVVPKARLDWAWGLRDPGVTIARADWEHRARWGQLADAFVRDWLECRTGDAENVMRNLADLDAIAAFFGKVKSPDRGLVVATVHLGPMFAGPLALALLDFDSRWLASTPRMASASYAQALISTSDQTEAQVARQAMQTIEDGCALVVAVDGAMNMASPRVAFEGQDVTYSAFAARLAYRQRVPSVFAVPQWTGHQLHFRLETLPYPLAGEAADDFAARWRAAYLAVTRKCLAGAPENLRLGGGIWRHIC